MNLTHLPIKVGEAYKRLNSRTYGIFHFKAMVKDSAIIAFMRKDVDEVEEYYDVLFMADDGKSTNGY